MGVPGGSLSPISIRFVRLVGRVARAHEKPLIGASILRSSSILFPTITLFGLLFITACAPPCERFCDVTADYIEFCLENGSQGEWTNAGDWSTWGATDKDAYLASCHEDLDGQLAGAEDTSPIAAACEDDANRYLELTERGLCADVP